MNTQSYRKKVFILTDLNSPHSMKWINGLGTRDYELIVYSIGDYKRSNYEHLTNLTAYSLGVPEHTVRHVTWKKFIYLKAIPEIRRLIKKHQPDVLHAHRVNSNGLLGAFTNFHPYIVSVWGGDIYTVPDKSWIIRAVIKYVFTKTDQVLSTSHAMVKQTRKFTDKPIAVTPFGIDTTVFKPKPSTIQDIKRKGEILIGTVKTLEDKYGIDYLIKAFHLLIKKDTKRSYRLMVVGSGSKREEYEKLAGKLGLEDRVLFTGKIPYQEVVDYHNLIDIFVALSVIDSESFGVAIIEASACEKPVVVSDVAGPAEVVDDKITGFVVPARNEVAAAEAMMKLGADEQLRKEMGKHGRAKVKDLYEWEKNLDTMCAIYDRVAETVQQNT